MKGKIPEKRRALDLVTVGHLIYDSRCYVENFPSPDKTVLIESPIRTSGGGSAANVAVDACILGKTAGLIANVGTDRHGAFLIHELKRFGVDTKGVNTVKGESGSAIILIDHQAEVEVIESIGVTEGSEKVDAKYIASARHLHMAGTSLQILEKASAAAEKAHCTISFDPGRSKSKLGADKLSRVLKRCHFLIVNRKELMLLTGEHDTKKGASVLAHKFGLTCVIKGGRHPVIVEGDGESFEMAPFEVKPVDTIGAGDAFCAGFVVAMLEGNNLRESVKFANAVAAAKVLFPGAQSLPSRKWIAKKFKV